MEDWLAAGPLSDAEFDQFVRLLARYVRHDIDQFDHWEMPGPGQDVYWVDFGWDPMVSRVEFPDFYRPMWPTVPRGADGWGLQRRDRDGAVEEVGRWATPQAAQAYLTAHERSAAMLGDGRTYELIPPAISDAAARLDDTL